MPRGQCVVDRTDVVEADVERCHRPFSEFDGGGARLGGARFTRPSRQDLRRGCLASFTGSSGDQHRLVAANPPLRVGGRVVPGRHVGRSEWLRVLLRHRSRGTRHRALHLAHHPFATTPSLVTHLSEIGTATTALSPTTERCAGSGMGGVADAAAAQATARSQRPAQAGTLDGRQCPARWARRSATATMTAGLWPKPRWLPRTSTFS